MSGMKINDRQMKQAMKKMGIKQSSVNDVLEVVIKTKNNEIVIKPADVMCIEISGNKSYQISGDESIRRLNDDTSSSHSISFSEEDIKLVISQTGCERNKAVAALADTDGQPAEAIIKIMSESI